MAIGAAGPVQVIFFWLIGTLRLCLLLAPAYLVLSTDQTLRRNHVKVILLLDLSSQSYLIDIRLSMVILTSRYVSHNVQIIRSNTHYGDQHFSPAGDRIHWIASYCMQTACRPHGVAIELTA